MTDLELPCKRFEGYHNAGGYGVVGRGGRTYLVHRLAWMDAHGPVPDGLELDHLCRVRDCYEVTHLEPVTRRENVVRSPIARNRLGDMQKAKTHCPQGHSYDGDNLYVWKNKRYCKECQRKRDLERKMRRRQKK